MGEEHQTTAGAEGPPIVSVGADVDVQALVEEVQAEVARKVQAGLYPPELMIEVNQDPLGMAVVALRDAATFSSVVPVSSGRARFAGAVSVAKRVIAKVLSWHTRWIVDQMHTFGSNAVATSGLVVDRLHDHDRALTNIRSQLARVREVDGLTSAASPVPKAPSPTAESATTARARSQQVERDLDYLQFENRFRGSQQEVTERQAAYLDLFRQPPGRVVDLGCGRGEFLDLLRGAEVGAYGVDMSQAMVSVCGERGLDARQEDVLEHLAGVPEGSLGGIFCAQVVEHLDPAGVIRFFELAWAALGEGGVLVVETLNPRSLATFTNALYVDLGHVRPLHPLTLTFLAERVGFRDIGVRYSSPIPDGGRLRELPATNDARLQPVVSVMNENLHRIDEMLFGPQDFAVVARR
jgi:SAM-dependent methyltransferase